MMKMEEMKKFSDQAWESISDIYDAIVAHPFNKELLEGSLSIDRFSNYIIQDAFYLANYSRSNAVIASKAPPEYFMDFLQNSENAYSSEQKLVHNSFKEKFSIQDEVSLEMTPASLAYVTWLFASASMLPVEVAAASVLPCLWIYRELGNGMIDDTEHSNPYYDWISAYSSQEFSESVDDMIDIVDALAESTTEENRELMLEAFRISSVYEWHFWDDAYNMRLFGDLSL